MSLRDGRSASVTDSQSVSVVGVSIWMGVLRWRSVEIQLLGEHGDHTRDLLLLGEPLVLGPGLEAGGHHVVDPCQDLHDLQLLAKLIEDVAQGLDEPGPAARVSPGVVPCRCGMVKDERFKMVTW